MTTAASASLSPASSGDRRDGRAGRREGRSTEDVEAADGEFEAAVKAPDIEGDAVAATGVPCKSISLQAIAKKMTAISGALWPIIGLGQPESRG
ncbi:MAG: hypothetical protein IT305_12640 [Chloroflexi bacterium]|nr:hypothetical protein [Chloroflexota bacterium]